MHVQEVVEQIRRMQRTCAEMSDLGSQIQAALQKSRALLAEHPVAPTLTIRRHAVPPAEPERQMPLVIQQPAECRSEGGAVILNLDGMKLVLTPAAAVATASRLLDAAAQADGLHKLQAELSNRTTH